MESKEQEKSKGIRTVAAMLMLVLTGLICVAGLQHFRETKSPTLLATPKDGPQAATAGPSWHLQLLDIPAQKAFIGFKQDGQVYIDASELCLQPGFRERAENRGVVDETFTRPLFETPDIALPRELTHRTWQIVSSDAPLEHRVFDTPYQWLDGSETSSNHACLFLGKKVEEEVLKKFRTHLSEPVVGLMGFQVLPDVRLEAQEGWAEVTKTNRLAALREFPWLLSWLNMFSRKGADQCVDPDDFMTVTQLLPIRARMSPNSRQDTHWLVTTGCEILDHWSLVMMNEDGTVSFITVTMPPDTENYRPARVWTADIDNDEMPEFLIKAQYYEGSRYVLLRLSKNDKGAYCFTEIAGTSYEGL